MDGVRGATDDVQDVMVQLAACFCLPQPLQHSGKATGRADWALLATGLEQTKLAVTDHPASQVSFDTNAWHL